MTTPKTRLRLTEQKAEYLTRTGQKITNRAIAEIAFKGMRIDPKKRGELLSRWDAGERMKHCTDRILTGICTALGCTVKDLTGE